MHARLLAGAKGAAVDLGDEDGRGDATEEVQNGYVLLRQGRFSGGEGFLEGGDVDVTEEVIRVGAVEDDDFRGWGRAVGGLDGGEEGEEVREEGVVDEVDGGVVECHASYVGGGLDGESFVLGCVADCILEG